MHTSCTDKLGVTFVGLTKFGGSHPYRFGQANQCWSKDQLVVVVVVFVADRC